MYRHVDFIGITNFPGVKTFNEVKNIKSLSNYIYFHEMTVAQEFMSQICIK